MSFITETIECPICFDCIGDKNNITTECGHKFHASCLMTNITRNGFGCPCCRTLMAEHDEEDNESDESTLIDDDDETDTLLDEHFDGHYSDDALRGLRLLTDLLEGNEQDQADVVAEHQYINNEEDIDVARPAPPKEDIVRMLREQDVTYEQLVAWILVDHEEYEQQSDELERFAGDLWGRMRIMISNYTPVQAPASVEAPTPVEAPVAIEEKVQEPNTLPADLEISLSPIHSVEEYELYEFKFAAEENDSFINFRRNLAFDDLHELEMEIAEFMIDYAAQPKTPICVK